MPKTILVTNGLLLACLSVLASTGLLSLFGGGIDFGPHGLSALCWTALACAVIFLATETLTGVTWVPIVALVGVVTGWIALDGAVVTMVSQIAWALGWFSVAVWFGYLAFRARENRW